MGFFILGGGGCMDGFTALTLDLHIRIKALTNWLGNTTTAAGRLKLSGLEIEVRYYSCLGRFIIIFFLQQNLCKAVPSYCYESLCTRAFAQIQCRTVNTCTLEPVHYSQCLFRPVGAQAR